jgi:hypothetical protein
VPVLDPHVVLAYQKVMLNQMPDLFEKTLGKFLTTQENKSGAFAAGFD